MRAGGQQGTWPAGLAGLVLAVKFFQRGGAAGRVVPHLVERHQRAVAVKGGVFDPLGHHRAGGLLESAHEQVPFLLFGLVRRGGSCSSEHVANEVEHGGVDGRVAVFGLGHGAANKLPVLLRDAVLVDIGAIDRKAGEDLAERASQLVESKVPRAAVPLAKCD